MTRSGVPGLDWLIPPHQYELSVKQGATELAWVTTWSTGGATAIHAYAEPGGHVAAPDYTTAIEQVDDADALTYSHHSATFALHGVVVFRNQHGHALCRVREIDAPPPYGLGPGARLEFTYELRPRLDAFPQLLVGDDRDTPPNS